MDDLRNPQMLQVRIKVSKTDPFRSGVNVFACRQNQWQLMSSSGSAVIHDKKGLKPRSTFYFSDGKPLTRSRFVSEVKEALAKAGVDSSCYSGHSFRSGAATTAAKRGIGETTIKMLGRWQSNAYQVYIKTPRDQLAQVSRVLSAGEYHL